MSISTIVKTAGTFVKQNSALILAVSAGAGVVTTTVLAVKAAPMAEAILQAYSEETGVPRNEIPLVDKAKLTWREYVPTAASMTLTLSALVGSQVIHNRKFAALAATLAMTQNAAKDYRDSVVETLTAKKAEEVQAKFAEKQAARTPKVVDYVIDSEGSVCYDVWSGRYFVASPETIRKTVNDANHFLNNIGSISLNEFYEKLGLPGIKLGEDIGWDGSNLIDVAFAAILTQDSEPCMTIDFRNPPTEGYWKAK